MLNRVPLTPEDLAVRRAFLKRTGRPLPLDVESSGRLTMELEAGVPIGERHLRMARACAPLAPGPAAFIGGHAYITAFEDVDP